MSENKSDLHDLTSERRKVLIVEDEMVNRELLKLVLKDDYDLIFVETGEEATEVINAQIGDLSMVLLDLNLPDMNGIDILKNMQGDDKLRAIPVIVLTADRDAEVSSLDVGAADFISKPYPRPEVIKARVRKSIELSEDRIIIGQTEFDHLTGLYNREFFYHFAEQFDFRHGDIETDAIVININHFHLINERYGRAFADEVLKHIGERIKEIIGEDEGIACRREADTFLIYCKHRTDYTEILEKITEGATGAGMERSVVRIRMGVYPRVDKSLDEERRFDRAKSAADTVKSTFTKAVAIYDDALHESAIFAEQLLLDFPKALSDKQFKVYYQPKYDIRGENPVLSSAEALVRWEHPEFGMVNPGLFIELFEDNGLIESLDTYVWKEAAAQIKEWKERFGKSVPVSVNVSRVDMFNPDLANIIHSIVRENNITQDDFILEVTESAYTEDSDYIISMVQKLRSRGFFIEMDDFGSGYSSLNMLTNLPIDALKLDMQFVRSAFKRGKDTRLLEIVIEIAESLDVPVIAEGVETEEQMLTLKELGCDIAQGFYFSKPVPAEQFEEFLHNI